jgi:hypothetical protein
MKLLYLQEMTWELDYFKNEIFADNKNLEIEFFNKDTFRNLLSRNDLIGQNMIAINSLCDVNDIVEVVKKIKPVVIFYLSDEYGQTPEVTATLEKYTNLFFRQHNFKNYKYSTHNYHIPLGYSTQFLNGKPLSKIRRKPMDERRFNVSFIGAEKSDRLHMKNVFNERMDNTNIIFVNNTWDITKLPYSPQECFNIYNKSIFVVSGRGNYSLECFRNYEALVAGAIPIIVGENHETDVSYNFNNTKPPFIYADNWESAADKCKSLLNDEPKLQKMQDDLTNWWNELHSHYKKLISDAILKSR